MARAIITGDKRLDRKLAALSSKDSRIARRSAVMAALTVIAKGIRTEVPVGETKALKKSIGSRMRKEKRGARKGQTEAKVGVNVGKKKDNRAPHSHLVALGTKDRWTGTRSWKNKGGTVTKSTGNPRRYRGKMPTNDFVERGFNKTSSQAMRKCLSQLEKKINEAAKKK